MSSDMISPHRTRVNGALLAKFHSQKVCLLGTVDKADAGGMTFQMKTSDGQTVNIRLKEPLEEPLSGVIEVYGTGQGKGLILGDSYTLFPEECTGSFDMNTYNEAIKIIHTVEGELNPWVPS